MLEIGDNITVCIKRNVLGQEFSDQEFGIVVEFLTEKTAEVSLDVAGRQEIVSIPVRLLTKGAIRCDTCIHRLKKLTTNNCPAKYERRGQLENKTDRTCDSAISGVSNNHRLSDVRDCS